MAIRLWFRWKQLAHKAAELQGQVLFFLLYFVVLLPMALVLSLKSVLFRAGAPALPPHWRERHDESPTLDAVRRQF